jgi:hypothetical protein
MSNEELAKKIVVNLGLAGVEWAYLVVLGILKELR